MSLTSANQNCNGYYPSHQHSPSCESFLVIRNFSNLVMCYSDSLTLLDWLLYHHVSPAHCKPAWHDVMISPAHRPRTSSRCVSLQPHPPLYNAESLRTSSFRTTALWTTHTQISSVYLLLPNPVLFRSPCFSSIHPTTFHTSIWLHSLQFHLTLLKIKKKLNRE